ncbi:MAG: VWA domain-containing protein [Flavobacteriales bacterium]|nr:VWA domain-containing protein [Flavobacteriales bacterium]
MSNFQFDSPWWFIAFLLIPILIYFKVKKNKKVPTVGFPNASIYKSENSFLNLLPWFYFINKLIVISCIIIALARPQIVSISQQVKDKNGIEIMLSIDVSLSMLSRDLLPDRLSVLKEVAEKFILNRPMDKIGIVTYAAEGLTKVPPTSDKNILISSIEKIQTGELEQGTAIGMGLVTCINHLKDSDVKSKIIILMTDGENNSGAIDPLLAADIAKEKNIKVYTIGIGTNGMAQMPVATDPFSGELIYQNVEVNIDENLLKDIATKTGGKYFRATSESELSDIYKTIDKLEKSKIEDLKIYDYQEKYSIFVLIAFALFIMELITKLFIFKTVF